MTAIKAINADGRMGENHAGNYGSCCIRLLRVVESYLQLLLSVLRHHSASVERTPASVVIAMTNILCHNNCALALSHE